METETIAVANNISKTICRQAVNKIQARLTIEVVLVTNNTPLAVIAQEMVPGLVVNYISITVNAKGRCKAAFLFLISARFGQKIDRVTF